MIADFTDADARAMWRAIRAQYPPDDDLVVRAYGNRGILPIGAAIRSLFVSARITAAPHVPPIVTIWRRAADGTVAGTFAPSVFHGLPIPEADPVDAAIVWRRLTDVTRDNPGASIASLRARGLMFCGTVAEAVAEYRGRIESALRLTSVSERQDWRRSSR